MFESEHFRKQVDLLTFTLSVTKWCKKQINFLYDNVGWGHYDDKISKVALDNTLSLYDEDKIIGYGRIIGDVVCFLYIQDIMVRK